MVREMAVFGAGCFWGVELEFSKILGVVSTEVGFMGGKEDSENYSYEEVCSGKTKHAEVVRVMFDSDKVSYSALLDVFWRVHNPTTLNRQGPDIGDQYRSAIFFFNALQEKESIGSLKKEEKRIGKKIVTEIVRAGKFYKAEEYHQSYLKKQGKESCEV